MVREFAFWTARHAPASGGCAFGCAAHGFAAAGVWHPPDAPGLAIWPHSLSAEPLAGSYETVRARLDRIDRQPAAAIILFSHDRGIELFLQQWQARFPGVPVAGGGAAVGAGQTAGELLPAAADVAVLLIRDGRWRADSLNAHEPAGAPVEFRAEGPRTIASLRDAGGAWMPAAEAFRARQAAEGRDPADCESLTFSDAAGRNIHCRFDGESLRTGADLPTEGRLVWRRVSRADAAARLAAFCSVPNALVFGCAGLRGLLDAPLQPAAGTLVGFMFGELVTVDGRPRFGNLMASRLAPVETKSEPVPEDERPIEIPGVAAGGSAMPVKADHVSVRPEFALEGREDEVYHELRLPGRATEPEYCAFLDQSWTFNRAMRWRQVNGAVLCHEIGGPLELTGAGRVSDWFSDPANRITHSGAELRFEKASGRRREAVVLPGLQTNLDRHPRLDVEVAEADADWQVCVLVKGRSGPPLVASEWRRGAGRVELDLAAAWRAAGYAVRFAELHVAVGLWTEEPGIPATLRFRATLPGQPALAPCLPVIRTAASAAREGVPVSVMAIDANVAQVTASIDGRMLALTEQDGVWRGLFNGLPEGEHRCHFTAAPEALRAELVIRVTDGRFISYDSTRRSLARSGRTLGPLSGSYQGLVCKTGVGAATERMINGQALQPAEPERWHYWEALTEAELEERFIYLQQCGWDLLHISQGWGIWEKLDAGGHIAPHGAEQLALLLRVAARHGLALLQALSHYPYGKKSTPVLRQYIEAGFTDTDWANVETPFTEMFHGYLGDFAALFREEPALFAMSTSGEGDIAAGPDRVNDTYRFMRRRMPNHLFLAEPIHRLFDLPDAHRRQWHVRGAMKGFVDGRRTDVAWEPQLAGSRMYWIGLDIHPEVDLGIEFKFLQKGDYFMGEGSWPCPRLYARFMGLKDTWAGTERYRRRVRDSLYLGLVHRCPMLLTWEEQLTEDERIVLREARGRIDWKQPFQEAPVAIRVDSPNVGGGEHGNAGRAVLGQYEEFFSAQPLMTRYLGPDTPAPADAIILDARHPFSEPMLPPGLMESGPLRVSPGYRASYLWSADRRTLLAYVYNCTGHEQTEGLILSGNWHRAPRPAACRLALQNLPAGLMCRVFSLSDRQCLHGQRTGEGGILSLEKTTDDFLVLVTPEGT